jgi:hypothetical protein
MKIFLSHHLIIKKIRWIELSPREIKELIKGAEYFNEIIQFDDIIIQKYDIY